MNTKELISEKDWNDLKAELKRMSTEKYAAEILTKYIDNIRRSKDTNDIITWISDNYVITKKDD